MEDVSQNGQVGTDEMVRFEYEGGFKLFLDKLISRMEKEQAEKKPPFKERPLFVFVSKKGYWIYRFIERRLKLEAERSGKRSCWEQALEDGEIEVKSDRYFTKMTSLEEMTRGLRNRLIFVVDDFLERGKNIIHFCNLIRPIAAGSRIIPAVFMLSGNFEGKDDIPEFKSLFAFNEDASPQEVGGLSVQETMVFHRVGIPYVIDLPFLKISETGENREDFFSGELTMEQFETLWGDKDAAWQCKDDSYFVGRYQAHSCFFYCNHDLFMDKFQHLIQNLVVECECGEETDGRIPVTFTPFAILRSVRQDELISRFQIAFAGTEYEKTVIAYLENPETKDSDENLNTALYRAVVFFFSRYISINFKNYLYESIGLQVDLRKEELAYHWSQDFLDSLDVVFGEQFRGRVSRLYAKDDITPYRPKMKPGLCRGSRSMYYNIFSYFAFERMTFQKQEFCSLEEVENAMAVCSRCETDDPVFRNIFTQALLQLLNQGVISNQISYCPEMGIVRRGFRPGENSTLLLPVDQKAVFKAIYTYYHEVCVVGEALTDGTGDFHRAYYEKYPVFRMQLVDFIISAELDRYLNLDEVNDLLNYFGEVDERALALQMDNKAYILEELELTDSLDAHIARLLERYVKQMSFE